MSDIIHFSHPVSLQKKLEESELKYRTLVENAMFGVFIFDLENIYFANSYAEDKLGYSKDELYRLTIWDIVKPKYYKSLLPPASRLSRDRIPYKDRFTVELICKSKDTRIFEAAISSINYHGRYAFQGNLIDITHLIRMQKELEANIRTIQQLENKNRNLIENLNDGFALVNTGLKILQINKAFAYILDYEPEELLGISMLDIVAYPHDQIALLTGMQRRLRMETDSYELNFRTKTGRVIPTHISPTPYIEDGKLLGCFAILKDLTEIKEAQTKISYQNHIISNICEGILVTDRKGILTYINTGAEQIFDINASDFIDKHASNLLPLINTHINLENLDDYFNSNDIWQKELEIINPKGKHIFVRASTTSIRDSENNIIGLVSVISDLTEIIRSRREAETASQAKTNFLANVSHDIRTPMIGIVGASDLLAQERLTPFQAELVTTIQQCGEQLLDLINDILDLSRIEAGYTLGGQREFRLDQLLSECVQTVYGKMINNVRVYTSIAPDIPLNLVGDPLQIRRIILNLLSNAIKFTPKGEIKIEVQKYSNNQNTDDNQFTLLVTIEDTGKGIPADKLDTIFEAFTKLDNQHQGGTGLGLTICKELVELLGGKIWVESELGVGSKFSFFIPVEKAVVSDSSKTSDNKPVNTNLKINSKTILVVEDNQINRKILSYMLYKAGYTVHMVEDGSSCLKLLETNNFDLIIMDMQMPILDGYETSRRIRSNPKYDHIPILALTAFAMEGDQDKCLQAGCNSYLSKPLSSSQLYNTLNEIFADSTTSVAVTRDNEIMEELLPDFIDDITEMLENIKISFKKGDTQTIANITHDIKGTAGMYGFNHLSELAARMHKEIHDGNTKKANEIYLDMQQLVEQIKRPL